MFLCNPPYSFFHQKVPNKKTLMEQLELLFEKRYKIPGMTENPAEDKGMLRRWIRDFCKQNGLKLQKGFYSFKKNHLKEMFYGMLDHYGISVDDITNR